MRCPWFPGVPFTHCAWTFQEGLREKCQFRTKHQAASCDAPTSPGGWRRGSQEAGIERQSAYTLGMQGQPGHQAADSHKDGVEAEVKKQ